MSASTNRVQHSGLQIAELLYRLVNEEIAPGTGVDTDAYWTAFADIIRDLAPRNRELLAKRDAIQAQIDQWHHDNAANFDAAAYKQFLSDIGYLLPEPADFSIATENVDDEIATLAGPQLVVPVMNARFGLNAANARWGSLYDALYGTDVISEEGGAEKGKAYNPVRGDKVIAYAKAFLNKHVPLAAGSHADATAYCIDNGSLRVTLKDGSTTGLQSPEKFTGYMGSAEAPSNVLLINNGLHIDIQIDGEHPIGKTDAARVKDVCLEAAQIGRASCRERV